MKKEMHAHVRAGGEVRAMFFFLYFPGGRGVRGVKSGEGARKPQKGLPYRGPEMGGRLPRGRVDKSLGHVSWLMKWLRREGGQLAYDGRCEARRGLWEDVGRSSDMGRGRGAGSGDRRKRRLRRRRKAGSRDSAPRRGWLEWRVEGALMAEKKLLTRVKGARQAAAHGLASDLFSGSGHGIYLVLRRRRLLEGGWRAGLTVSTTWEEGWPR